MARTLAVFSLLLASLALPLAASAAEMIADLQPPTEPSPGYLEIRAMLSLGELAVFTAREPSSGVELWATDGTSVGTELLRDLCPGFCSSDPTLLGAIGRTAFLVTEGVIDSFPVGQMWKSDGTKEGTSLLTGSGPRACSFHESAGLADTLLFLGHDFFTGGCRLWRTDGTAAGTHLLEDLAARTDGSPHSLTVAGGRVFFAASPPDAVGGLWRTDGTAAGTVLVRSFPGAVTGLVAAGTGVLFRHTGADFSELWRSDGTAAGTVRIARFADPRAFGPGTAQIGNRVFFQVVNGNEGLQIWTAAGPSWQAAPLGGCPGGCPRALHESPLFAAAGRALFTTLGPDSSVELWSTDGSGPGTRRIATLCQSSCTRLPRRILPLLGQGFFLAGSDGPLALWRTDGTAAGTVPLAEQSGFAGSNLLAAQAGNRFVFNGSDRNGDELWVSDGSAAGTVPLTVYRYQDSSHPVGFVALGDRVAFRTSGDFIGRLWLSGGTAASTVQITDKPAGAVAAGPPATGALFFLSVQFDLTAQMWRTDGTPAGTFQLTPTGLNVLGNLVPFGGKMVAVAGAETGAQSFWESDGTVAGTRKLFDLPAGVTRVKHLTPLGPELYFAAAVDGPDRLFRSDGTAAGTRQITTHEHGDSFFHYPRLVRFGAHVYFVLADGDLWRTDGTAAGTVPALELEPFPPHLLPPAADLAELQGALYLLVKDGLWKSDGTTAGSVLLKTFTPTEGGTPSLTRLDGHLYFNAADEEHGTELWRTDGTAAGTVLVRDILPGEGSSYPQDLEAAGDRLFFTAGHEEHGRELWESDGTEAGTRLVQDIAPGALSSSPSGLTAAGGQLFFAANDLVNGLEPWVHPLSGPGCQPGAETLCLGGGRFRVEASWRDFQGNEGRGTAVALTGDTGYFWFFDPANVEVILKVLDGQGLNGHHWVFYGALSTVEYTLTVTDTQTGAARRYINPPNRLASVADIRAFGPLGAHGSAMTLGPEAVEHESIVSTARATAAGCAPNATRLCLQGGRFAVEVQWTDFQGNQGVGKAVSLSSDTGYFWFFGEDNVEVVLKVLDGRPLNGKFWVFYGALSSVEYTLTVTDTETGQKRTYHNPSGRLASVADTGAF